jgi:hypothetical protein
MDEGDIQYLKTTLSEKIDDDTLLLHLASVQLFS